MLAVPPSASRLRAWQQRRRHWEAINPRALRKFDRKNLATTDQQILKKSGFREPLFFIGIRSALIILTTWRDGVLTNTFIGTLHFPGRPYIRCAEKFMPETDIDLDIDFDCAGKIHYDCKKQSLYKEHDGKQFCVFHYPGLDKSADFEKALRRKIKDKDFDFRGVSFPDEVDFSSIIFKKSANFFGAIFNAKADFTGTSFEAGANFSSATFRTVAHFDKTKFAERAQFDHAVFNEGALFQKAEFKVKADFKKAQFKKSEYTLIGAYFGKAAFADEADFSETTFDFGGFFGECQFKLARFDKAKFNAPSVFKKANFAGDVYFNEAVFVSDTIFRDAYFKGEANFSHANFSAEASFSYTTFEAEANFSSAVFGTEAFFSKVIFGTKANFSHASFKDYVRFVGNNPEKMFSSKLLLNLGDVRIEKPDHISFHTLTLLPHWFVNVDTRKFDFINVEWRSSASQEVNSLKNEMEWRGNDNQDIKNLKDKDDLLPYRLLSIVYRQLAMNAEDNHRYEEASNFRYWSMDIRRREKFRGFAFWKLDWWYWAVSGYGERMFRALTWLFIVWVIFAALYMRVEFLNQPHITPNGSIVTSADRTSQPLELPYALTYSLGVMSLQKPEPQPSTNLTHALVTLEMVFGPVQAALLLLAIRRKFMR